MKIKELIVLLAVVSISLVSCNKNTISSAKIKTRLDSLSYAFGVYNYNQLKNDSLDLNPSLIAKAMVDGKKGKMEMTEESARAFIMSFISQRESEKEAKETEMNKIKYKDYIAENEAFLAKNKEKAGVTTTPSGLQYEVIKMGTGSKPTAQNTVKVHYTGTLIDGTEFDSSVKRGTPVQFPVSGVIPGWTEALQLMPVGSKFKLCIPQNLAYGPRAASDKIKPFSTLIFEVELLEIVK
jgi:FKBP-type peptidyl-prolyl cis-trans isomerase